MVVVQKGLEISQRIEKEEQQWNQNQDKSESKSCQSIRKMMPSKVG